MRGVTPRCLITGAASGIGRALAVELGGRGASVVGLDVFDPGLNRLESEAAGENGRAATLFPVDLTAEEQVEGFLDTADGSGAYDLVVHSAGISAVGPFAESELIAQRRVIAVNLAAPIHLTTSLLRRGVIAPGASIVFISSLSRFVGYPGAAGYAATKDGLASFARSLSVALAPHGIHVLTVYPGATRTPHARRYSRDNSREDKRMAPERVAREIVRAVRKRRRVLVPGVRNKAMAMFGQLFPGSATRLMRRVLFEKVDKTTSRASGGERGASATES